MVLREKIYAKEHRYIIVRNLNVVTFSVDRNLLLQNPSNEPGTLSECDRQKRFNQEHAYAANNEEPVRYE